MINTYEGLSAELYDAFPHEMPGETNFYLQEAWKAGSPVLELGCGTGRITLPVAKSGVKITGIDLSEDMLNIADNKAGNLPDSVRKNLRLQQGDMKSFRFDEKFSLIIIPFRSFLHLMTSEDQCTCLQHIFRHLENGGKLIFNIFDPNLELMCSNLGFSGSRMRRLREIKHSKSRNPVIVWYSTEYDLTNQLIDEIWIYDETDSSGLVINRSYVPLKIRYIYRFEMQYLLELSGFSIEALYKDFHRNEFKHGEEQIWICRK